MGPQGISNMANVAILDEDHRQSLERALVQILQTDLAEQTYAKILDSMPTSTSYSKINYYQYRHPAMNHTELCPDILDKAREFRANFDVATLQFSSSVS